VYNVAEHAWTLTSPKLILRALQGRFHPIGSTQKPGKPFPVEATGAWY
jgi:hypothetical protein